MNGTKVIYGYKDLDHAIMCTVKDLIFKGMDILIVAECAVQSRHRLKCFSGWRYKPCAVRDGSELEVYSGTWSECLNYCRQRNWKWIAPHWALEFTTYPVL